MFNAIKDFLHNNSFICKIEKIVAEKSKVVIKYATIAKFILIIT